MDAIILQATVTADRRLIVDLPADVPVGAVTVTIQPTEAGSEQRPGRKPLTRAEARAKLLAAGRLSTIRNAPEGAVHSSPAEADRLARLFSDSDKTTLDLVDWTRGPKP